MSRLSDLIRQVGLKDEQLGADLQREVAAVNLANSPGSGTASRLR